MIESLFDTTSIPILEQVVGFTQARHGVLAGNVANLDTPGYRSRDLSLDQFHEHLREAIEARDRKTLFRSPGEATALPHESFAEVKDSMKSILYHDESDVSLEKQIAAISKNQMQHNLALTIMMSQFRLLEAAISERLV